MDLRLLVHHIYLSVEYCTSCLLQGSTTTSLGTDGINSTLSLYRFPEFGVGLDKKGVIMDFNQKTMAVFELTKNNLRDADAVGFPVFDELLKSVVEVLKEGKSVIILQTED